MNRLLFPLALTAILAGVAGEVRAEEPAASPAPHAPTSIAVGLDGWLAIRPNAPQRPDVAFGYGFHGRYRVLPHFSLGAAVARLQHDDRPCYDSWCTAPATLVWLTARYQGLGDGDGDPWIQLGLGAGISQETSYVDPHHQALDRVAVRPSFEAKAGIDFRPVAFLAIGPDARLLGFGDPYRIFAGLGAHLEARW